MTAPAILLAPDPEMHARIVAWETLARTNPKATFGPAVLLAVTAELRNARMAAHLIEAGLQRCEVENDELAEQLRAAKVDGERLRWIATDPECLRSLYDLFGEVWIEDVSGRERCGLLKAGHDPLEAIRDTLDVWMRIGAA